MLKISKPLSTGTTKSYYKEEYTKAENATYYTQQGQLQGEWHGKLASEFELRGTVTEAQYDRLVEGQHPHTAEQLIQHRDTVKTAKGEEVAHRASWDLTFGAPKSVSAAALVGGDDRVREAHRQAVKTALNAMEEYVQARMGGDKPAQTTANMVSALFEHDTARPVGGGAPDPHLHTHAVTFNMTRDEHGQIRSLQTAELFRIQQYATAVYQSELSMGLKRLGYELSVGEGYAPEIKGFTKEYLDSISQRTAEIKTKMKDVGVAGAEADEIIAKQTRANKQVWGADELRQKHRDQAQQFGNQPDVVVRDARQREYQLLPEGAKEQKIQDALTYAKDSLGERQAVFDRYEVLREALRQGPGDFTLKDVETALDRRIQQGEFVSVDHYRSLAPGARYTTPEMIRLERETLEFARRTIDTLQPISRDVDENTLLKKHPTLTEDQARTIREVLQSADKIHAIQGGAGTGKSFVLSIVRDAAETDGYTVKGIAPTSSAANNLLKDGIDAETLQAHLMRGQQTHGQRPALYLLDETSLTSTKGIHEFLQRLGPSDRVVLVGDTRQHQSVEAGRIFEELQQSGMKTSKLDEIVRQKNPELRAAIEDFAQGNTKAGLQKLAEQGRIEEMSHRGKRFAAIAERYLENPKNTLVISPDNDSRKELNRVIQAKRQDVGQVQKEGFRQPVLVNRQDVTGAQRKKAAAYHPGNIVRFEKESKALGIERKTYAEVLSNNLEKNEVTLQFANGKRLTYDPKRFYGVQLYTVESRQFSVGDRVQFTAPWKDQNIANRQLGTISALDKSGNVAVEVDGANKHVSFNLNRMKHVDLGYAVTSYSSQSLTVDNTLLNIETGDPNARGLLGKELTYVALSRSRHEVTIFTDDANRLGASLGKSNEKAMALSPETIRSFKKAPEHEAKREQKYEKAIGMSMSF